MVRWQRWSALAAVALGITTSSLGWATPRDQAYQLYNRLTGVPPSAETLDELETLIEAGDIKGAAMRVIDDEGGMFYNLFLKTTVARWTNADKSPRVPLNDFTATVIGMIRDDVPFNQALTGDIVYTGSTAGLPAYSLANNTHYEQLEAGGANLKDVLVRGEQSTLGGLPADATAGVMTTRAFGDAYYKAGTNRRAVAFSLDLFLCNGLETLMDTTRADFRVRRDVTRAPGGDTTLFRNRCAGCHAGMDAIGGAFAYYDWADDTNSLIYTPGTVRPKYNRNATEFPDGFVTQDDSWLNLWTEGQNARLGWKGAASGNGLKALGGMYARSDAFAECMAKRAYTAVCLHAPEGDGEKETISDLAADFKKNNYNMKDLFATTASQCVK